MYSQYCVVIGAIYLSIYIYIGYVLDTVTIFRLGFVVSLLTVTIFRLVIPDTFSLSVQL